MLAGLMSFQSVGQDKKALKYAKTITTEDLRAHLSVLASDSLEGRETGERGQKMAAEYIRSKFQALGLTPPVKTGDSVSYYQSYPLKKLTYNTSYLKKGDEILENTVDFLYYSKAESYGEEYIDVIFVGEDSVSRLEGQDLTGKYVAIVNSGSSSWRNAVATLENLQSEGVFLIIEDDSRYNFVLSRYSSYMTSTRMSLTVEQDGPKIFIGNPKLASWIFDTPYEKLKKKGFGKTAQIIMNADLLVADITAENVLGYLEGSEKPEEVLVITAHYDHIGITEDGQINNGADDDASGTSTVLELAEAFVLAAEKGHRPRRSILFMTVSGEEKGLLGSEYYANNPVFAMENTVANLNIDMVGRVDEKHEDNPDYIYLIGSDKLSQDLHQLSEKVNRTYSNLELDYTYNDENDPNRYYYRSDHYNFAKKNVPVIFYFNGTHEDYHQPTDTIEKINFEKMEKIGKLIFHTAWEIANREERIKLDQEVR